MVVRKERDEVLIKDGFSSIRQFIKAVVDHVEIGGIERKTKLLEAMCQGASPGVLAQHHPIARHSYRRRSHDLVSQRMGQHSVLMNTRFVRKRIAAHHRLIWRRREAD